MPETVKAKLRIKPEIQGNTGDAENEKKTDKTLKTGKYGDARYGLCDHVVLAEAELWPPGGPCAVLEPQLLWGTFPIFSCASRALYVKYRESATLGHHIARKSL